MKKISVIMPSFLGEYEGCASNRDQKFIRAVNSFLDNTYKEKELIIVSDGCPETIRIYEMLFEKRKNIRCLVIHKQPLFSGNIRQFGLSHQRSFINADIETYLDSDDIIKPYHLHFIAENMNDNDFIYYPDTVFNGIEEYVRIPELRLAAVGTSNIAHISKHEFNWIGCDGYNHDFKFISEKLMLNSSKYEKINDISGYKVMHIPNAFDN
jgi:glycosyltransferase involved in cell wall biosynthesis